ncbi:hypothetical protein Ddye_016838, partial [Dipteronia dyeriana]
LEQEFNPVMVPIATKNGEITIQEAHFLLMSFEAKLEHFEISIELHNICKCSYENSERRAF